MSALFSTRSLLLGLSVLMLPCSFRPPMAAAERETGFLICRPRSTGPAERALRAGEEVRTGAGERRRVRLPGGSVVYVNEKTVMKMPGDDRLVLAGGEMFVEASGRLQVQAPQRQLTSKGDRFAVRAGDGGTAIVVVAGKVSVHGLEAPVSAGQQLAPNADKPAPAPRAAHLLAWTQDLMAAAETPLVPPSAHAGGSLLVVDPDGQQAKLGLRRYHVDVHIEDGFARTTIDQTYFNHTAGRLEGTFSFPLPADASLSRLAMYVDGQRMEGGMVERDYGRTVFESIVHRQKDPALLEWVDGTTFKMRVFPLEPRQEKRILLSYTQRLPMLYGTATYRFPAGHNLGLVRDLSFHANVSGGGKLAWNCPSHALKEARNGADLQLVAAEKNVALGRDVVLTLADPAQAGGENVRFSTAEQDGAKYLILRYRPELPAAAARTRRDWVFLVETSGDRDPLLARTQVEIVRGLLASAGPDDTLAVLAANTRTRVLAKEPQPVTSASVQEAMAFLEGTHLIGALDLGKALSDAAPYLKSARDPVLVHLGSGIAALGERRSDELIGELPAGARYVGIGVGRRWSRAFMKQAAEKTAGWFTQINPDEPISWRALELASALDAPRLLGATVTAKNGRFLLTTPSLAQGEELCAVARFGPDEALPETVTIRGTIDGRALVREVPVRDAASKVGYLPRAWAQLEIDRLLTEDAVKHKAEIIALSKANYVMTPFTSLLVLESEAMYQQYKVDRNRKEQWAMYSAPHKIPVVEEDEDGRPVAVRKGEKPPAKDVVKTLAVRRQPRLLGPRESENSSPGGYTGVPATINSPTDSTANYRMRELLATSKDLREIDNEWERLYFPPARALTVAGTSRLKAAKSDVFLTAANDADASGQTPPMSGHGLARLMYEKSNGVRLRSTPTFILPLSLGDNQDAGIRKLRAASQFTDRVFLGRPNVNGVWADTNRQLSSAPRDWNPGFNPITGELLNYLQQDSLGGTGNGAGAGSGVGPGLNLTYQPPAYAGNDALFFDLVSYAPGLNTSRADMKTVLEAEAADAISKAGIIDPAARELFEKSRPASWRSFKISADGDQPAYTITFDGTGRYAYARTLPIGIRERVVCDGQTILHLYPDLGLAAKRTVSRFHRIDFSQVVPWVLPRPEDLARGADLRMAGARTVALVPHGADKRKDKDGKPLPYMERLYVFAADGPIAEMLIIEKPSGKVLYKETYSAQGVVRWFDEKGKDLRSRTGELADVAAPNLKPDLAKLVVLPLPYRDPAHVRKTLEIEKKALDSLPFDDALKLLAAEFAASSGDNKVVEVFKQSFHGRDQRQLGFYVLLAACGQNLDGGNLDVLSDHLNEPLAQYLALHSSPVLRKHASQWAVGSGQFAKGFLQHLSLSHALLQRWQNGKAIGGTPAQRKAQRDQALDYVRRHKGSAFGWALLGLMKDRADEDEAAKKDVRDVHRALADAWRLFVDVPELAYCARYEHARSLWKSGQRAEGRKAFRTLYETTLKDSLLPRIDANFREALLGMSGEADEWSDLQERTARKLIADGHRHAALVLGRQCVQLGDQSTGGRHIAAALSGAPEKEKSALTFAAIDFFVESAQFNEAEALLEKLLADPKQPYRAALWRLGAHLAEKRERPARELECLEQALDAEFRALPEIIDFKAVRADYEKLLGHYQEQAKAVVTLKLPPPAGFQAKVVRVADRWRALDPESAQACQLAARTLRMLGDGDRDLAWDYLTTPVALRPNEAEPWSGLARDLQRQGDLTLADRAFAAAYAAEPTNAELLWEQARNLRQAGQAAEAQKLFRRLAEGDWQPRFRSIQSQAQREMEKR